MLSRLRALFDALLHRRRLESEMDAELRFHMDAYAADLVLGGASPADAQRRARVEFGAVESIKDDCRQSVGLRLIEELRQDLRYATRCLLRSPGFTAAAIASLALAIGANTIIFSFVNGVIIKPYPYRASARLVRLFQDGHQVSVSPRELLDLRDRSPVTLDLAARAIFTGDGNLSGGAFARAEHAAFASVTANYFDLLGIRPILGRGFRREENGPGRAEVLIVAHRLWRERMGSDPAAIGKLVRLNDREYRLVGILPPGIFDRETPQAWIPLEFTPAVMARSYWLTVVGRLRDGIPVTQASAALKPLGFSAEPIQATWEAMSLRTLLRLLWGAVTLLLLMGCVNVGNLLLARAAARRQEVAIRLSIGAGRGRLVRQFLTESLLLGLSGGALGLILALATTGMAARLVPPFLLPPEASLNADWRVLLYTAGVSVAAGILFGLAPAWQFSGSPSSGMARGPRHRLRAAFLVAETALAAILAAGAGLVTHSFTRLSAVDPGFQTEKLLTWSVRLSARQYSDKARILAYQDQVLDRLRQLPEVVAATAANALPMRGVFDGPVETVGGTRIRSGGMYWSVTPDYLSTLRIRLLKGRWLEPSDGPAAPAVAVINETLARNLFGTEDPLGRTIRLTASAPVPRVVVGIVHDLKFYSLQERRSSGEVYLPVMQSEGRELSGNRSFAVRSRGDAASLLRTVHGISVSVDGDQPVFDISTMEETIAATSLAQPLFRAVLFGGFGLLGLLLAAAGVYGVLRYAVAQRTHEIGVRMALGARGRDVVLLVMRQSLLLIGAGLLIGMAVALGLTRLLASMLFEIQPRDPGTLITVGAVVAVAAIAAAWLPARRAASVQPATILRHD